jgi:hypothetical protein
MKALVFNRYGGPDHITFADTSRPVPKPDENLVQVHAAGLNPIDYMIPKGVFKPIRRFQLPATPGSDLAGAAGIPRCSVTFEPPPVRQHRSAYVVELTGSTSRSPSFMDRGHHRLAGNLTANPGEHCNA